ncbi:hypothetical protein QQX98_005278 [Neonectria punicea]|uniref:Uncharacterized protein n=1 Tax=Neonectria punicea TaxID=979145 RepID=A0ABR1H5F1_9HYPO
MKGRPVDQIVYECMFPRPKSNDPQNFHALLQRSLIPEVRQETHAFYGHLETQEAKYPGLDYTHRTHRIRLARWPWHRRLFRAFDGLRLTDAEIAGLTKWEGTKWAKEKFEREQGITIRDTTADGFPDWTEIEDHPREIETHHASAGYVGLDDLDDAEMDVESEAEMESVGVELNERLRAQAARREAGDSTAVLDEEWEQWLKTVMETGEQPFLSEQISRHANESHIAPAALFPPGMLSAARAGQWSEIPDFLHPILRRTLESEDPTRNGAPQQAGETSSPSPPITSSSLLRHLMDQQQQHQQRIRIPWPRRTYSDLRLPVGDSGPGQRAETSASGA